MEWFTWEKQGEVGWKGNGFFYSWKVTDKTFQLVRNLFSFYAEMFFILDKPNNTLDKLIDPNLLIQMLCAN